MPRAARKAACAPRPPPVRTPRPRIAGPSPHPSPGLDDPINIEFTSGITVRL